MASLARLLEGITVCHPYIQYLARWHRMEYRIGQTCCPHSEHPLHPYSSIDTGGSLLQSIAASVLCQSHGCTASRPTQNLLSVSFSTSINSFKTSWLILSSILQQQTEHINVAQISLSFYCWPIPFAAWRTFEASQVLEQSGQDLAKQHLCWSRSWEDEQIYDATLWQPLHIDSTFALLDINQHLRSIQPVQDQARSDAFAGQGD